MTDPRAQALQSLLEAQATRGPGVLLGVDAPFQRFSFRGAAGPHNLHASTPIEHGDGFRIASMSKTFTGVLASQLEEAGLLDLDAPVLGLLPASVAELLEKTVGKQARHISSDLLLHHRAGFSDFALSPAWFGDLAADPGRFRPPEDIACWALQHGEILCAPDTAYRYSDTGFVLMGLVLEHTSGQSYAQLCRERIFDPLAMHRTWLEGHEEPRSTLAHCYLRDENGDLVDALQVHGSCDWAAGGHVSTLDDLDRFLCGLTGGELFQKPRTLDRMLAGREAKPGFFYGRGIGRKQIGKQHLWGHLGHWGSFMYVCPEQRLRISGSYNHDSDEQNAFLAQVLRALGF